MRCVCFSWLLHSTQSLQYSPIDEQPHRTSWMTRHGWSLFGDVLGDVASAAQSMGRSAGLDTLDKRPMPRGGSAEPHCGVMPRESGQPAAAHRPSRPVALSSCRLLSLVALSPCRPELQSAIRNPQLQMDHVVPGRCPHDQGLDCAAAGSDWGPIAGKETERGGRSGLDENAVWLCEPASIPLQTRCQACIFDPDHSRHILANDFVALGLHHPPLGAFRASRIPLYFWKN
jgi:hypothetical protein